MVLVYLTSVTFSFHPVTLNSIWFHCRPGRIHGPSLRKERSPVIGRKQKGYRRTDRPTYTETYRPIDRHVQSNMSSLLRKGGGGNKKHETTNHTFDVRFIDKTTPLQWLRTVLSNITINISTGVWLISSQ